MSVITPQPTSKAIKKTNYAGFRQSFQNIGAKITKRAIQSDNYVPGTSGLKIDFKAGTGEFRVLTSGAFIKVFIQAGIPTSLNLNDLWIDIDDDNKRYYAASVGANEIKAGEWVAVSEGKEWDDILDGASTKPADNADVTSDNLGGKYLVCTTSDNIQTKINAVNSAGGGTVLLDNGTHTPGGNITLYSNVYLIGRNSESCIIDFENAAYGIRAVGSNNYSTGTLSVSNGSVTVTGSGTTWTAAMIGRSILLAGLWYPITAVGSTTSLTIGLNFADEDLSGENYVIATTIDDIKIETLTVKRSTTSAIKFQYANEFFLSDDNVQASALGIDVDDSSNFHINEGNLISNASGINITNGHFFILKGTGSIITTVGVGFNLNNCSNAALSGIFPIASATNGFSLTDCKQMAFFGCTARKNGAKGFELISGNDSIMMTSCGGTSNASDGIKLTATSDNCVITAGPFKSNGGYGINIAAATCDNNSIRNNIYLSNTSGDYNDSGTGTKTDA
ncbi:right-handed parallel beta-helix repeat-containing protein [Candidatus Parcubacteria bacterium]|nr:right-handed parallel beta-helix repeat-containing protein [Candidatus Parcubacteria bacterium]